MGRGWLATSAAQVCKHPLPPVISSCIRYIVRKSFRVTVAAAALLASINSDVIRRSCGTREVEVSRDFLSARRQLEGKRKRKREERNGEEKERAREK